MTGSFDNWGRTVKLEKRGDIFEKEVQLPSANEKIHYKFVVDGNWVTDSQAPEETDNQNNINNVLLPEQVTKVVKTEDEGTASTGEKPAVVMSGVNPDSTTAELAAQVPKETKDGIDANGEATASTAAVDEPRQGDIPGGFPITPANEADKEISVNPIPASSGIGNPIRLAPGEPVPDPSTFNENTVESTARTDKESYEAGGSAPEAPGGDDSIKPAAPGVTIMSAAPTSTTAALAGQVPLESSKTQTGGEVAAEQVPDVVKESLTEAKEEPEAAANPQAVEEKKQVEEELRNKVEPENAGVEATTAASEVPEVVKKSLVEANEDAGAAANSEAVAEKSQVESELQSKVPVAESAGEPAPTTTAATSATAPGTEPVPENRRPVDSAPVSPGTTTPTGERPPGENAKAEPPSEPTVTTGVVSGETSKVSEGTNNAAVDKDKKKKNRTSGFFAKLKEKFLTK